MGAWIETVANLVWTKQNKSHPTWVRGLKQTKVDLVNGETKVAPYVGAWIETKNIQRDTSEVPVAPYVGAWIETLPPRFAF